MDKKPNWTFAIYFVVVVAVMVAIGVWVSEGLMMMLGGLGVAFCAFKDYDWFMTNYRAGPALALLGRKGARALYVVVGFILFLIGLLSL